MKVEADPDASEWLTDLIDRPRTGNFEWDTGNRSKQAKHGVTPAEVEELFLGKILFAGRIIEPAHDEPRWLLLGATASGRPLALIFTRRGDRLRAISCRPMRRNERKLYEEANDA